MSNPGYGQTNPFANPPSGPGRQQQPYGLPPSSYSQPRYGEPEASPNDPYGSQNSSTTRLAGAPAYYDQNNNCQYHQCGTRNLAHLYFIL